MTHFTTGDRVQIKPSLSSNRAEPESDEKSDQWMRIIDGDCGPIKEIQVDGKPLLDFEINQAVDPEDTVALVAYESTLNSYTPGWESNITELDSFLENFKKEWSVDVNKYYFAHSILTR